MDILKITDDEIIHYYLESEYDLSVTHTYALSDVIYITKMICEYAWAGFSIDDISLDMYVNILEKVDRVLKKWLIDRLLKQ